MKHGIIRIMKGTVMIPFYGLLVYMVLSVSFAILTNIHAVDLSGDMSGRLLAFLEWLIYFSLSMLLGFFILLLPAYMVSGLQALLLCCVLEYLFFNRYKNKFSLRIYRLVAVLLGAFAGYIAALMLTNMSGDIVELKTYTVLMLILSGVVASDWTAKILLTLRLY